MELRRVVRALAWLLPALASATIVVGPDVGGVPTVKVFAGPAGTELQSFLAFAGGFTGGVRVATGDVNGDGLPDVVAGAGPGGGPQVSAFDGQSGSTLSSFFAYDPAFTGGVFVAAGDVNNDGVADLLAGAGAGGGPQVKAFDGQSGVTLSSFLAFAPTFLGGVTVGFGDVNNDGFADIITGAGPGGGPQVKVFDGQSGLELSSFFAYDPSFAGGVFVAGGDVNNDGFADIITGAGQGGTPHVKVFDGQGGALLASFFAYDLAFAGGVRVAGADLNGDGFADIVTGSGPGGVSEVRVFSGNGGALLGAFAPYGSVFADGIFVGASPLLIPEPGSVFLLAAASLVSTRRRRSRQP
jgi:hypothetical protein